MDHIENNPKKAGQPAGAGYLIYGVYYVPIHTRFESVAWFSMLTGELDKHDLPTVIGQHGSFEEALNASKDLASTW